MKSIFVVGSNTKETYRIRTFLDKDFNTKFNPSVHNALAIIKKTPYNALLFDSDNVFPLDIFMDELRTAKISCPVSVLASKINAREAKKMLDLGVVSIIKTPCSKVKLVKGIENTIAQAIPKDSESPIIEKLQIEIETWLALRKHAIITRLRKDGINMLLPTALNENTKVFFKNSEICKTIGYVYNQLPRFEVVVNSCVSLSDYLYSLNLSFTECNEPVFLVQLHRFIDQELIKNSNLVKNKKVLVADTDEFTRKFYLSILEENGYTVKVSSDGIQALKLIETEPFDLVILDLSLHRLSGFNLITEIRKQKINVPIAVATGERRPDIVLKLASKIQKYLLKPFNGAYFKQTIMEILEDKNKDDKDKMQYADIHLETNVLVTFQDRFKIIDASQNAVIFSRPEPIALGTHFLIRRDAISTMDSENRDPTAQYMELQITKCAFKKSSQNYIIQSDFVGLVK
jgi:DNA-binding response OmpR family regulator